MAQYDGLTEAELAAALEGKADKVHQHGHGSLSGLTHDHHPQYLTGPRGDARYYQKAEINTTIASLTAAIDAKAEADHGHTLAGLVDVGEETPADGQSLVWHAGVGEWRPATLSGGGGATDHSALSGLADDDHPQYLNTTRGDARYYLKAHIDATFYTQAQVDSALAGKANAGHSHTFASLGNKPDTLDGYGITDAARLGHSHVWAAIGDKPTTLAGFGITDAAPLEHSHEIDDITGLQDALNAAALAGRVLVSSNHSAAPEQVVGVDSSAGAITITAPAAPNAGAYFYVGDAGSNAATNNITVDFGAESFNGSDQVFVIDVNDYGTGFLYTGSTWRLFR